MFLAEELFFIDTSEQKSNNKEFYIKSVKYSREFLLIKSYALQ